MADRSDTNRKIFCIGAGKTGTTSLGLFLQELGFRLGDQAAGELLLREWAARRFEPVIGLARTAQAFQDMPFNCPLTFQAMDAAFPGSKFVLSVRDDPEQWYRSLTRFHTKLIGKGRLPTAEDLKDFPYRYKGWILEALCLVYGVSETDPYEKDRLIAAYQNHNRTVEEFFRLREDSFLKINLSSVRAARTVAEFLDIPYQGQKMPHSNRSD
jgi:Sulfotransferase domain